jgi:hypothetical protein
MPVDYQQEVSHYDQKSSPWKHLYFEAEYSCFLKVVLTPVPERPEDKINGLKEQKKAPETHNITRIKRCLYQSVSAVFKYLPKGDLNKFLILSVSENQEFYICDESTFFDNQFFEPAIPSFVGIIKKY